MSKFNTQRLEQLVEDLRQRLGSGLMATDIWEVGKTTPLASYQSQPAAVDLIGSMALKISESLRGAGFPGLDRYFLLDMEGEKSVLVLRHGNDLLQGMLLDTSRVNMGIVLSIGLRTAQQGVQEARG